jgi:hypothetical protein
VEKTFYSESEVAKCVQEIYKRLHGAIILILVAYDKTKKTWKLKQIVRTLERGKMLFLTKKEEKNHLPHCTNDTLLPRSRPGTKIILRCSAAKVSQLTIPKKGKAEASKKDSMTMESQWSEKMLKTQTILEHRVPGLERAVVAKEDRQPRPIYHLEDVVDRKTSS